MSSPGVQIHYAPAPLRQRHFALAVVGLSLLILASVGVRHYVPRLKQQYRIWKCQQQEQKCWQQQKLCMDYVASNGKVAWTAAYNPATPQPLPTCWSAVPDFAAATPQNYAALAFLHRVRHPDGCDRLVAVFVCPERIPWDAEGTVVLTLQSRVFPLPLAETNVRATESTYKPANGPSPWPPEADGALQIHGGQIDPNDPGRFTVAFDWGKQKGVLEGRLKRGGDEVSIRALSGPSLSHWASTPRSWILMPTDDD